ncbi:tyrosine-type recombinase/integrase [Saliphagus sp. GCM10025334]
MNLEPIDPETAVELYLADRETELRWATVKAHKSRLGHFVRWCDERDITNCNALTGRLLHEYRIWRRNEGDLAPATEKTQLDTLRVFVRWLGTIDGVHPDLHHKVRSPNISDDENTRSVMLDTEDAERMLAYLEKYEYATRTHVVVALLWHTMLRRGAVRGLDLADYDRDEQFLAIVHRPDTDTPVKNGKSGERLVALSDRICDLLDDYIRDRREDVTDEYSRKPLITTTHGRVSPATIAKDAYCYSRPCVTGADCPHGRDPESCEYMQSPGKAPKCPSSVSPHAYRRGGITHYLASDVPETAVSQRANVSPDVLEQHYDQRTKREKMEQRRQYLSNI